MHISILRLNNIWNRVNYNRRNQIAKKILDGERLAIELIATTQPFLEQSPSDGERLTALAESSNLGG